MNESKTVENDGKGEPVLRRTPPIVSPETWETAREQMLVKEKTLTRARERPGRRTPADAMDGRREGVRIRGAEGQG